MPQWLTMPRRWPILVDDLYLGHMPRTIAAGPEIAAPLAGTARAQSWRPCRTRCINRGTARQDRDHRAGARHQAETVRALNGTLVGTSCPPHDRGRNRAAASQKGAIAPSQHSQLISED